jgi:hypothetical protein
VRLQVLLTVPAMCHGMSFVPSVVTDAVCTAPLEHRLQGLAEEGDAAVEKPAAAAMDDEGGAIGAFYPPQHAERGPQVSVAALHSARAQCVSSRAGEQP